MSRTNLTFLAVALGLVFSAGDLNAATIAGVTIENFSSELEGSFDRGAVHVVDGSGLAAGLHTNVPDNFMWLNSGNGCCGDPADPFVAGTGAQITFDLGANYDLTSFHLWNYNEGDTVNLTARGANAVEIQVAITDVLPVFTTVSNTSFPAASGLPSYAGVDIPLLASNVRLVRFNITSNHGGDNEFIGLSEITFDGVVPAAVPEPASIALWSLIGLGLAAFGCHRVRRKK